MVIVETRNNAPSSRVNEPGAVRSESRDLSVPTNCDDPFAAGGEGLSFGLATLQRRHLGIVND
jgi:hypothetical protein